MKIPMVLTLLAVSVFNDGSLPLSSQERKAATEFLTSTRSDYRQTMKGLSVTQLNFRPDSTRWSIAQCAEHIALVEIGLFQLVEQSLLEPVNPDKRSQIRVSDKQIVAILTNRTFKATSPEVVRPIGKFPSVQASLAAYEQTRQRVLSYLATTQEDLRNHLTAHPAVGTIDAYQMILLLAAHNERHRRQIEEVKHSAGFP